MIRILIVDDEEIIANSLYNFFRKQTDPEADVFKAYAVDDAVVILEKYKIDLIISDISMPQKSGIEFMQIVKVKWPLCRFIFLTGYDYFEYAYEALKAGGIRYILKTEGYKRLLEVVREEINAYRKIIEKENLIADLDSFLSEHKDIISRDHIFDMLDGRKSAEEVLNDRNFRVMFVFEPDSKILLIEVKLNISPAGKDHGDHTRLIGLSRMAAEKWITLRSCHVMTFTRNDEMVIIAQPLPDEDSSRFISFVIQIAESIQDEIRNSAGLNISIAVPGELCEWLKLPALYKHLRSVIMKSYDSCGGSIIVDEGSESGPDTKILDEYEWILREIGTLGRHMESCDKNGFMDLAEKILMRSNLVSEREIRMQILSQIGNLVISSAYKFNIQRELFDRYDINHIVHPAGFSEFDKSTEYLLKTAEYFFELLKDQRENHRVRSMENIKKHIEDNIGKNMTLTELSEISHYNASYLSKVFKEVTGSNITDFILEKKIERAKELLGSSDLQVNEVSEMLSFGSAKYFTEVFRKSTGVSPRTWKDSFNSKQSQNYIP